MKTLFGLLIAAALLWPNSTSAQEFVVGIEKVEIPNLPRLQSFAYAVDSQNRWLLVGGRIDGLHRRQPFASFDAANNNTYIYVVDPAEKQTYITTLATLSTPIQEQLQSTNMCFVHVDEYLYLMGGYGFSATANDHITHDKLTAINVDSVTNAIVTNKPIAPFIQQITDSRVMVTGGQVGLLDSTLYLVGGQNFQGRYNPMGPNNGPGFFQQYTEEIRKFNVSHSGGTLTITNYEAINDAANLHRRDYNMLPTRYPDVTFGFTAYSGVFQHTQDLPWLNVVDIKADTYLVRNDFNQYLSQYHSAKLAGYDAQNDAMYSFFFGGIARYMLDSVTNQLIDDPNVPFVNTISLVERDNQNNLTEYSLQTKMPGLLGSGAELIPHNSVPMLMHDLVDFSAITDSLEVGYIYGGIESTQPNIFFINTGVESVASNEAYKVIIYRRSALTTQELTQKETVQLQLYPNPNNGNFTIEYFTAMPGTTTVSIYDLSGKVVYTKNLSATIGKNTNELDFDLSGGTYKMVLQTPTETVNDTLVITE